MFGDIGKKLKDFDDSLVWSKGKMLIFGLIIVLTAMFVIQNNDFNKTYADVIENKDGRYDSTFEMGQGPPMIPVEFEVLGNTGEQTYFFHVPHLSFTPEWQKLMQLRIMIIFLLPLAIPKIKDPKKFWDKVKAK